MFDKGYNCMDNRADNDFSARMQKVIEKVGSADRLAVLTGISATSIGKYARGEADPSRQRLIAICEAASVPVAWLATGQEEVSLEDSKTLSVNKSLSDCGSVRVNEYSVSVSRGNEFVINEESAIGAIAISRDFVMNELKSEPKNLVAIHYSGESMPKSLGESGKAFVDISKKDVQSRGVFLIRLEEALMIKNVQRLPGRLEISGENHDFKPFEIAIKDFDAHNFAIIGKVVGVVRRL